jgi:hypothetical protein
MRITSGGKMPVLERGGDAGALGNLLRRAAQAGRHHAVADDAFGQADAFEDGDAGRVHHGKEGGKARQDNLVQHRADQPDAQLEAVGRVARLLALAQPVAQAEEPSSGSASMMYQ